MIPFLILVLIGVVALMIGGSIYLIGSARKELKEANQAREEAEADKRSMLRDLNRLKGSSYNPREFELELDIIINAHSE